MKTFTIFADPGHAWARVPLVLLNELGISERITRYSYQNGRYAYLEEDRDLATFWMAYREIHGKNPVFKEQSTNRPSCIRRYRSYTLGR